MLKRYRRQFFLVYRLPPIQPLKSLLLFYLWNSQHEPVIHPAIDLDNILTHDNMERLTAETPSTLHNYNFSEQIRQNSNTGNPQPESTNAMPILLMEEERNGEMRNEGERALLASKTY